MHDAFEMIRCQLGVVRLEVDAERDRDVGLLGGRGDDHLLRSGLEVLLGVGAGAEAAARLDHDLDAELAPGQRGGIAHVRRLDPGPVDDERALDQLDGAAERAVDGVVLEQVREHRGIGDVVDRDPLDVGARLERSPECGAAGSSEAVDGDTDSHGSSFVDCFRR